MHFIAANSSNPSIYHITFLQAIVIGLIQGFFELFPLSSLGHTVLIPAWIGGSWATLVRQESSRESPYLAFIVGLHLANAIALFLFYLREWSRLIAGFVRTVVRRRIVNDSERLAWLIVLATIPVGILGLVFEHTFRTLFAKPLAAAIFLSINGVILLAGEWFRRRNLRGRSPTPTTPDRPDRPDCPDRPDYPDRDHHRHLDNPSCAHRLHHPHCVRLPRRRQHAQPRAVARGGSARLAATDPHPPLSGRAAGRAGRRRRA